MILVIHQSEQSCIYAILPATVEGLRNYLDALHSVQYFKNSPIEKHMGTILNILHTVLHIMVCGIGWYF